MLKIFEKSELEVTTRRETQIIDWRNLFKCTARFCRLRPEPVARYPGGWIPLGRFPELKGRKLSWPIMLLLMQ
jgi:hypothetical protein